MPDHAPEILTDLNDAVSKWGMIAGLLKFTPPPLKGCTELVPLDALTLPHLGLTPRPGWTGDFTRTLAAQTMTKRSREWG